MSAPIISVEHLSKRYLVGHRIDRGAPFQYVALRDMISRELRNAARKAVDVVRGRQVVQGDQMEEFWALSDVSFTVQEGEVLGIIGRNGAGKSTLLKILSRITEPTAGRITLRGRVASLLEVGTGFHPELSGRENIFLNGAILGMTRGEIRRKFDEIVAFAEIEKFIDTPVKRYSSGMYVRLAFAVAAHLEPEILIVDEVLAVGDAEFQKKCLGKMDEVSRQEGRTVLFVSHNMPAVSQLTDRVVLLAGGRIARSGDPQSVIEFYSTQTRPVGIINFDLGERPRHYGTGEARMTSLRLNHLSSYLKFGESLCFTIGIKAEQRIPQVRANMTIYKSDGTPVGCAEGPEIAGLSPGEWREMTVTLAHIRLSAGSYYCAVSIGKGDRFTELQDYDIIPETLFFEVFPEEDEFGRLGTWHPGWGPIQFEPLSATWEGTTTAAAALSADAD